MKIVVTGGHGKVGRYLVAELMKDHEVTVLDVVQAFRLAAEVEGMKHEVMFISAANLLAREETMGLLKKYHPTVTDIRADLSGHKSLVDYSKATRLLGYEPKHDWTEIPEA